MNETVLIIDDSAIVIRVLKDILKSDYRVISASNGNQGLEMAREENASLILMGVDMPGEDGYSICRKINRTES